MVDDVRTKESVINALHNQITALQKLVNDLEHSTTPDLREIHQLPALLQERRDQLNLGAVEVAELAGLSPNTYRALERGEGNPRLDTLESIGDVLNIKIWIEMA